MDINKRILEMCAERGWSVYTLSQEAVLTQSTVNSMFQRKSPPKIETLQAICDAFGITLSQFFAENESFEPLTDEEREIVHLYRHLPKKKKEALRELMK